MTDVTTLMTVYNGMPYLRQAVESLCAQTVDDWRCVIVDDGSTDGTGDFLRSIRDARIHIIHQENTGTAAAANRGLEFCNTRYLARMDADDVTLPTRLAEQAAFLDAHAEVGLVGAQMAPLGSAGIGMSLQLPTEHEAIMAALLAGRHGMAHSCIMLRTELLKRLGGYWPYRLNDAWDMMLRMGEVSRLANLDRVLHHYRVHDGSQTGSRMKKMRFSIALACELARRRRTGAPPISADEFQAEWNARPWWRRAGESVDLYARGQYRMAIAERYGGRRLRGSARLAWAALCAPQLTIERLARMAERHDSAPARNTHAAPHTHDFTHHREGLSP
jgi:glycosyltransferase involved in cell wall biosynthesis